MQAKGKAEPVTAFRLVRASLVGAVSDTPLVGRGAELDRLRQGGRLQVVVGEPGIGKTRLVAELAR